MIKIWNNLLLYSCMHMEQRINALISATKIDPPIVAYHLKDRMSEIDDIATTVQTTQAILFGLAPSEAPKAAGIFADARPYREADIAKIIERGIKYNSVIDQGRYGAGVKRLKTMLDKCNRLIEWHTYLKEQVLV